MTSKLSLENRFSILDLLARYAWAYDDGDAEAYAAAFTPDGVLADQSGVLGAGREAIRRALKPFLQHRGSDLWRHYNDQILFEGGPDKVRVRSYWMVVATKPSGDSYVAAQGRYVTDVERLDGEWLIARREFSIDPHR